MYVPKALVVYLLIFQSFKRSSSDVLSVKTTVFLSKVIHFPGKSLRVGVHGRVYGNIERSTYMNFNAPFLQKLQPGVLATFMKLYFWPGAYLGVHFYIYELYTKFRVAWYQKREFCKFIDMSSLNQFWADFTSKY